MSEASGISPPGRRVLPLWGVLLLAALSLAWQVVPAHATELPASPLAGVSFTDAWSNDDGVVDDTVPDAGDVGDVNPVFDAHGTDSSDDPSAEGLDPPRYDKDVAFCSATVRDADPTYVDVTIVDGYPGYVCTFAVTFENGTGVLADVAPAAIVFDPGLTVEEITDPPLPATLAPGETSTGVFFVRVEEEAPQNDTLAFSITLIISGEDPGCEPLSDDQIPGSAILINDSGLCKYFFDGKPGACGPDWDEIDNRFAWHFVVNKTRGATDGALTAKFLSGLVREDNDPNQIRRNTLQFYVYTPTADTLVGGYVVLDGGDPTRAKLVLSNTCNDPDDGGHTRTSDLALVVSSDTDDGGTVSFTFVLANHGAATAADITVSRRLSDGLTVESVTATTGTFANEDQWLIPILAAGESAVLTITAGADEPGLYEATGEVVAAAGIDLDSVPGNGAVDGDDFAQVTARVTSGTPIGLGAATWLLLGFLMTVLLAVIAINHRRTVVE